jgi:hypothetical protein
VVGRKRPEALRHPPDPAHPMVLGITTTRYISTGSFGIQLRQITSNASLPRRSQISVQ